MMCICLSKSNVYHWRVANNNRAKNKGQRITYKKSCSEQKTGFDIYIWYDMLEYAQRIWRKSDGFVLVCFAWSNQPCAYILGFGYWQKQSQAKIVSHSCKETSKIEWISRPRRILRCMRMTEGWVLGSKKAQTQHTSNEQKKAVAVSFGLVWKRYYSPAPAIPWCTTSFLSVGNKLWQQ